MSGNVSGVLYQFQKSVKLEIYRNGLFAYEWTLYIRMEYWFVQIPVFITTPIEYHGKTIHLANVEYNSSVAPGLKMMGSGVPWSMEVKSALSSNETADRMQTLFPCVFV